jgi:RNA polymerase sigma-70 factor (ECF subfamily)
VDSSPSNTDALSAALDGVVSRFARMVRSVGARHGLSEADLDDVLQEVRIRLWRSCATSEQVQGLGASYVYRTAATAALDLLRRRRSRGGDLTDSVDEHSERLISSAGAAEALDAQDLERQVLRALDVLPVSRRMVVRMYLSGYEREEIAELLGWTEAKTRNLLYRGLADLRSRLAKVGITGERT